MGRSAILHAVGWYDAKSSLSCKGVRNVRAHTRLEGGAHLVLRQIIRQVGHHDLGLGWDAIRGRATLAAELALALALDVGLVLAGATLGRLLVSDIAQRLGLVVGMLASSLVVLVFTSVFAAIQSLYSLSTYRSVARAAREAAAAASATATTVRRATATVIVGAVSLLSRSGRGASELHRHLALENLLAREFSNGTLGLRRSGQVNKGVADRAVVARVLGNGDRLLRLVSMLLHHSARNVGRIPMPPRAAVTTPFDLGIARATCDANWHHVWPRVSIMP
jgi:hypothetical protein